MHSGDHFNCLQFNEVKVLDYKVELITIFEIYSFVFDRHWSVDLEIELCEREFMCEALLVCRLEKSGTEVAMHLDGATDSSMAEGMVVERMLRTLRALRGKTHMRRSVGYAKSCLKSDVQR